jgi:hypothetical protein
MERMIKQKDSFEEGSGGGQHTSMDTRTHFRSMGFAKLSIQRYAQKMPIRSVLKNSGISHIAPSFSSQPSVLSTRSQLLSSDERLEIMYLHEHLSNAVAQQASTEAHRASA